MTHYPAWKGHKRGNLILGAAIYFLFRVILRNLQPSLQLWLTVAIIYVDA